MEKPQTQNCPTCHKQSMVLTEDGTRYECQNTKCSDYRLRLLKGQYKDYNQRQFKTIYPEKKTENNDAVDETDVSKARLWNGNQYWDEKKKKWRDGDQPIRIHRIPSWLVIVGVCIVISIVITLILNYLHPGTRFSFFIW
jgi:hypothetical protein